MATNENLIPIPGRLHSVATEGHVAGADEIYDDTLQKDQATINSEVNAALGEGGTVDEKIAEAIDDALEDVAFIDGSESSPAAVPGFDPNTDTVHVTAQTLSEQQKAQVRTNIGLGDVDAKINQAVASEASRAQAAESNLNSGKADKATTLAGYGITDAYTKSETYTKTEVNGLVDTPHQEFVTVDAYASLPATGSKDTIYRVSNYNGSTSLVDASVYSEYAWDGTQYVFLCVKSQIGEVFDISVYNNNAKYADLAAALNGGANIPQSLQKGGMSIKFVQSSDNKYVQFRLITDAFTTDVSFWEENIQIIKGGGIDGDEVISFVDEEGNCPMQVKGGHIKTKEFDSREAATKQDVEDSKIVDNDDDNEESLSFIDEESNCPLQVKNGHIKTKLFDSSKIKPFGTKINDFSGFSGESWTISSNKKIAYTSSINNRLMFKTGSYEDNFNLSAAITPTGNSFEIAIGKYDKLSGTFFTLYFDGTVSKVRTYNIDSSGNYVLKNIERQCNIISFASGKKIFVTISKSITDDDMFTINLCDEYGLKETFTVTRCVYMGVGSGWGKPFVEMLSGNNVSVEDISFGYDVRNELDLIIIGHSYVEGNNLVQAESQDKDKRFAKLITDDIGEGHCLALGQGGDRIEYLINEGRLDLECDWFLNSKYALMYIGGNDVATSVGTASYESAVSHTKERMLIADAKLKAAGIIPVWCTVNWWFAYGKPETDTLNPWIIETFENVVDVRKIFEDGNGNLDSSKFASDGVHPNVTSHSAIYNLIKAQASYLFNV